MVERGTPVTRRSALALGAASLTLGLVGCRTGRNEIADAFARDRVRLLAVNVETTREAYATAVADLNQAAAEMLELFDELPAVPGPGGASYPLADLASLGPVKSGWLRGGWKDEGLWPEGASPAELFRSEAIGFFRDRYRRIERLARGEAEEG